MNEKLTPSPYFPLQAAVFEAGLAFVAIAMGWVFNESLTEKMQWSAAATTLGALAVLPLLVMLLICRRLSWQPLRAVWKVLDEVVVPLFRTCNWIELAAISLLAGVGEELLFRGLLQPAMAEWSGDFLPHSHAGGLAGDWLAVVAVAVFFGGLHAVNLAYAVLATIMGIYLGWLFLATGNLLVPMIAHGLYDFIALVYIVNRTPVTTDKA
jgi:membrane protease YdiL (CAAX protease family)